MNQSEKPYSSLGNHLRNVREQSKRSLAEVSGAIEVDEQTLRKIEVGQMRPDEEVMLLLINYFNVQDQEALHLWELARYDSDINDHIQFNDTIREADVGGLLTKPMIMVMAMDMRTMYSDGLEINWNHAGLTLSFTQKSSGIGEKATQVPVARVGLSYSQAERVLKTLERALLHAKYTGTTKLLAPPPNRDNSQL